MLLVILNLPSILHRSALVILLAALLPACKSIPEAPLPPTPQTLRLAYTPALRPWAERLIACAEQQPEAALFLEEIPVGLFDLEKYEAVLSLGNPPISPSYIFNLGFDELKIILNPKNPVASLDEAGLRDVFAGRLPTWETLSPPDAVYVVSVRVWFYLPESELAGLAGNFLGAKITNSANLAYNPGQVIEAVLDEPGALGLVTSSWLVAHPEGLKVLDLPGESLPQKIPVLAATRSEPQGSLRSLLACASEGAN